MNPIKTLKWYFLSLKESAELVKEISHKNCIIDMFLSRVLLNVRYNEYLNLGFYKKPWHLRQKYIVDDLTPARKYNSNETKSNNDDKCHLLNKISPYINRKVLSTNDLTFSQFTKFIASSKSFFYKPSDGCGGQGIKKVNLSDADSVEDLYHEIKTWPQGLLEETITQHPDMNKMCSTLVQTIRICVFKHKDGPKILFATLRTSRKSNSYVDNAAAGGIFANIDLTTGRVRTNAFCELSSQKDIKELDPCLYTDEGLEKHPITGTVFKGFQIPYFHEATKLVKDVASNIDFNHHRLLGFDIAITKSGPELVEVNIDRPDIVGLWQVACKSEPLRTTMLNIMKE